MFFKDSEQLSLPELEKKVLAFWKANKIFEKSIAKRSPKGTFVFYEGPPGANGRPGIHHVIARVFKDIICRYKTMQGFTVPRKSGWDTHGLPVEIAAEKELGLKSKKDIEALGIAAFNKKCREIVWQHKREWEELTERIGYWLDLEHPYITYDNKYIETLWWVIHEIAKKKLLYEGHKVVPWCTRCGTALSSHEVAQGYEEVVDQSAYVKFKLKAGQTINKKLTTNNTFILSWTTTPWTLPGNVALAVGSDSVYVLVHTGKESYILAEELYQKGDLFEGSTSVLRRFRGKDLVGLSYEPLFDVAALRNEHSHKIYAANFVTTTDGTGVVHVAPMYGEDDYALGKKFNLPQKHTVLETGVFANEVMELAGLPAKNKETEVQILAYLKKHHALFKPVKTELYKHDYPFCWRCHTPLIYYARTSWFVNMQKVKRELIKNNKSINWIPAHLKNGRFGEWLLDVKDWNFSRERYWGTPLPVWRCESCGHHETIGSFAELSKKAVRRNTFLFMRHGEATNNIQKIVTSKDTKSYPARLTSQGIKTVENTARLLVKEKIDLILTSPLTRTKATADILHQRTGAPVEVCDELREMQAGVFEGKLVREYYAYFKNELEVFTKPLPEGESRNDARRRMAQFFMTLNKKYKGKKILIVSHGDPLWMLKGTLEGLSNEELIGSSYPELGKRFQVNWKALPFDENGNLDVHRPYIDEVLLSCVKCGKHARRVKEVADVWFDSGAMPFAQLHYPFENKKLIDKKVFYPAEYISEAVDQTRGWFYTMLAVSTLLDRGTPYENVISLGHINDKFGRKMSKSKGNIIDPWVVGDAHGMDAIRWYFFTATPPGEPKNFDEQELVKSTRRFHMLFYNSLAFLKLYPPKIKAKIVSKPKHVLDRWILARLTETIEKTTVHLNQYEIREGALAVEGLSDDLSRWFIRRSRSRFQPDRATRSPREKAEAKRDHEAAYGMLAFMLREMAKLVAPFTPFLAEGIYAEAKGNEKATSVHLADWPKVKKSFVDSKLLREMAEIRKVASDGLAKRAEAGIKVRQPLATLWVKSQGSWMRNKELIAVLKDEVNVKAVAVSLKSNANVELDTKITTELLEEGTVRELMRSIQDLRQKAMLKPKDSILLILQLPPNIQRVIQKNEAAVKATVFAKEVQYKKSEKFDAEAETKLGDSLVWVGIRKV